MYDEIIYFCDLKPGNEKDDYGDPIEKEIRTQEIFAEKKSISQTEFYQAQTAGSKPEIKFIIPDYLEYNGQAHLIHAEMRYKILRIYRKTGSNELEITCYGGVRDANTAISDKNQEGWR
jgi:SPP1 family predicted phage head-tail adaptor